MSRERPKRGALPPAQENIEKLEKVVEEGNYYGAQQMYKSISARYVAAQRFSEAVDILQSGACNQLKHGQVTCGAELAALFVETLVKGRFPYDDETLGRVRKIYKAFPRIPVPQQLGDLDDMQQLSETLGEAKTCVEGCSSFLKSALKWSKEFGAPKGGAPEIHVMLANYIYFESPEVDMVRVSHHFVRGNNPKEFASTLVNFMGKCYPGEDDLAIARAILIGTMSSFEPAFQTAHSKLGDPRRIYTFNYCWYLAVGNLRDANILMDEIKKQVESKQLDFPKSDLIQFINFLLQTLLRDALPLFNMLRERYKSSLDREPTFHELLDEIAEKFYGVRRRNPLQGMGMFGEIFKMMGGE